MFALSGGEVLIEDCLSSSSTQHSAGGAIYALRILVVESSSNLTIGRCVAAVRNNANQVHGGAVFSQKDFTQRGGSIKIYDCAARGRTHVRGQFFSSGGGISSPHSFTQSGGSLVIRNCTAQMGQEGSSRGGAIYTHLLRTSGRMNLEASSAEGSVHGHGFGGAIFCTNISIEHQARVTIKLCRAEGGLWCSGGAVHAAKFFEQSGGSISIRNCTLNSFDNKSFGGGVSCKKALQSRGRVVLQACSAQERGGGLYAEISAQQSAGASARFEGCQSFAHGGAVSSAGDVTLHGDIVLRKSSAPFGSGGCLHIDGDLNASGLYFHDCSAGISRGALFARGHTNVEKISVTRCSSAISSTALVQEGSLEVANLEVTGLLNDHLGQHMVVTGQAAGEHWQVRCS